MHFYRRLGLVVALVLIGALGAGTVQAGITSTASGLPQQSGQTPEDICAAATENIQEPETRTFDKAEQVLKDGVDYAAVLCTVKGPIFVDLLEDESPNTVNNFVFLAQNNYYNNTTFHRVLPGFMAQGGDPTGTGSGDPGYEFANEIDNSLSFDGPGVMAMANAGPDTNGSQFFITFAATSWLDGSYNIFGRVIQGMEAAELLLARDPGQSPDFEGDTLQTVVIVEDPTTVAATPDGAPSLDHLQAMLENNVVSQILAALPPLQLDKEASHTYDLQAEAEAWGQLGGDELVAFLTDYLAQKNFAGTAAISLKPAECSADFPLWEMDFQVSDYGADAASVVTDNDRADKLVSTGAFDSYTDTADGAGRLFTRAAGDEGWCSENARAFRLEVPQGRYLLALNMVLDSTVVTDDDALSVAESIMGSPDPSNAIFIPAIGVALDRGNAE